MSLHDRMEAVIAKWDVHQAIDSDMIVRDLRDVLAAEPSDAGLREYEWLHFRATQLRIVLQTLYDATPDCEGGELGEACMMARKTLRAIPQAALRAGGDGWDAQKRLDAVLETYETHDYRGTTMHAAKKIWFHETGESCPICGPLPLAPEEET